MAAGRPREFDLDLALDRALDSFWHHGYGATTMRDLAARLSLSQSSIAQAFGSKETLLEAVLGRYLGRLDRALIAPLREGPDGLAAVDRFLADLCEWHLADGGRGCLIGRLTCEGVGRDGPVAEQLDQHRRALRAALDAALARAVAAGELAGPLEPERRNLVLAVVLALNLAAAGGYGPAERRALIDAGRRQVAAWRLSSAG